MSGSGSQESSSSSSSTDEPEEEAAAAEEALTAGPGQNGDTTDSDDDNVMGKAYPWAATWTGTRSGKKIRGRTMAEQRKRLGKKVATNWGGPGRVWTGTVIGIYNATDEFDEYERDLYTVQWDQREDEECDSDDQVKQDVEYEELEPMLLMHSKLGTPALDPEGTTGRAAFVSMEPKQVEFEDGQAERQSSNRKCPGGSE